MRRRELAMRAHVDASSVDGRPADREAGAGMDRAPLSAGVAAEGDGPAGTAPTASNRAANAPTTPDDRLPFMTLPSKSHTLAKVRLFVFGPHRASGRRPPRRQEGLAQVERFAAPDERDLTHANLFAAMAARNATNGLTPSRAFVMCGWRARGRRGRRVRAGRCSARRRSGELGSRRGRRGPAPRRCRRGPERRRRRGRTAPAFRR